MSGPSAVEARDLTVQIGSTAILDGVSLDVARGRWLGLVGPNGAGKTTLLRTLAGLVRPGRGSVRIDREDPHGLSPRRRARLVALVDQRPTLPPGMSVAEYVLLGRHAHVPLLGVESDHDHEVASEAMELLGVARFAARDVLTLSGGEAQRVVLARALTQEASVLLLDEPTSALDLGHQQDVLALVDELRHERSLTVISSLHDLTLAAQFTDDAVLLHRGTVVIDGPIASVLDEQLLSTTYGTRVRVLHEDGHPAAVVATGRDERRES